MDTIESQTLAPADLVKTMSLEQKIRLLSGSDMFSLHADESIGLSKILLSDGPTGVRGQVVIGGRESLLLPNASLLAQTWSRDTLAEVGDILAEEAQDQHTHVVLGPTINLHRTPLGGRLFECFSEDPLLSGNLAAAYIQALQKNGIAASPKHYLGNDAETDRSTVNSVIDERALREVYLLPFEIAVQDANAWTVMAAYNLVNGVASTEQKELIADILKDEWGFDGVVMSDWHATSSVAESANAGLDLVMPGPETIWSRGLADAVRKGLVSESVVDDHVLRLLRLAKRVGALAEPREWPTGLPRPQSSYRHDQLTRIAASGMVVLKNKDELLPLDPNAQQRIAIIGRHASDTIAQGGGSAQVRAPHIVSIKDAIERAFGPVNVSFTDGVDTRKALPAAALGRVLDPETGEPGIRVRAFDRDGNLIESRHFDRAELEDNQVETLLDAARIELSALASLSEPTVLQFGVRGPGHWHVTAPGYDEEFEITYHDTPGGGYFRPKSHTINLRLEPGALLTATTLPADRPRIVGLVMGDASRSSASAIAEAVSVSRAADIAIVAVGMTPDQETEGEDKTTLALPGDQDALVAAVAATAKRTVVVLNAASPVLMPWLNMVDAVLFTGLPGQEAGDAVAAALTGAVLPEGRLVTTFPNRDGEGPAWSPIPRHGRLEYTDSVRIGHRWWYETDTAPAFWFGHGLGFTSWEYSGGDVGYGIDGNVESVRVRVENVGSRTGRETVQVYLAPSQPDHPVRLIGWAQVELEGAEAADVVVACSHRVQRSWNAELKEWQRLSDGELLVGRSLGDVRLRIPERRQE
jgi:beta-glucosidase